MQCVAIHHTEMAGQLAVLRRQCFLPHNSWFCVFVLCSLFFLFSCSYGTEMNDHFTESKHDRLLFTFLCLSVLPNVAALRTLTVLDM
jgi:hypothetical protein